MSDVAPERPTVARLKKLIALAEDVRGDLAIRRVAKRKLALYAKFYPDLLKATPRDHSQSR
jgi:hypothetical protein